jgi:hypothetical protein
MKIKPVLKKVEVVFGCSSRWTYKNLRCRLEANASGITIDMKGGNRNPGDPGEGLQFHRPSNSLEETLKFIESLPPSFGPDECEKLGFKLTMRVLYD